MHQTGRSSPSASCTSPFLSHPRRRLHRHLPDTLINCNTFALLHGPNHVLCPEESSVRTCVNRCFSTTCSLIQPAMCATPMASFSRSALSAICAALGLAPQLPHLLSRLPTIVFPLYRWGLDAHSTIFPIGTPHVSSQWACLSMPPQPRHQVKDRRFAAVLVQDSFICFAMCDVLAWANTGC